MGAEEQDEVIDLRREDGAFIELREELIQKIELAIYLRLGNTFTIQQHDALEKLATELLTDKIVAASELEKANRIIDKLNADLAYYRGVK